MSNSVENTKAAHHEGGNSFHDIRLDLPASYARPVPAASRSFRRPYPVGKVRLLWDGLLQKTQLSQFAVGTGLRRAWFEEFHEYWLNCLGGRPLTPVDFHQLRFHYRCRSQESQVLEWDSGSQHVHNWQAPHHFSGTLNYVYKCAHQPIQLMKTYPYFKQGGKVLEYGCSLAPMYRAYRRYFSHLDMQWHLADIPNHAFHYSRYIYSQDLPQPKLHVIADDRMDNPVGAEKDFDLIICCTVFEHLHAPLAMAKYLIERLSPGGVLVFDYVLSGGEGLDTIAGVEQRQDTLRYLRDNLLIKVGTLDHIDRGLGLTIGRKKSS